VQEGARNRIDILQSRVQNATGALPVAQFSRDTMTGLPSRAAAEYSIASKIAEGKDFAVVLFIVDRLESINARFGRTIGDQILLSMAQHLAKQTSATSSLLRWSGPAFLQVLEIGSSFSAVERHAKKMAAIKMEKNIDTLGRSVILVVGCSFLLEKVTPQESAESVFRKLDAFLAARSGAAVDR